MSMTPYTQNIKNENIRVIIGYDESGGDNESKTLEYMLGIEDSNILRYKDITRFISSFTINKNSNGNDNCSLNMSNISGVFTNTDYDNYIELSRNTGLIIYYTEDTNEPRNIVNFFNETGTSTVFLFAGVIKNVSGSVSSDSKDLSVDVKGIGTWLTDIIVSKSYAGTNIKHVEELIHDLLFNDNYNQDSGKYHYNSNYQNYKTTNIDNDYLYVQDDSDYNPNDTNIELTPLDKYYIFDNEKLNSCFDKICDRYCYNYVMWIDYNSSNNIDRFIRFYKTNDYNNITSSLTLTDRDISNIDKDINKDYANKIIITGNNNIRGDQEDQSEIDDNGLAVVTENIDSDNIISCYDYAEKLLQWYIDTHITYNIDINSSQFDGLTSNIFSIQVGDTITITNNEFELNSEKLLINNISYTYDKISVIDININCGYGKYDKPAFNINNNNTIDESTESTGIITHHRLFQNTIYYDDRFALYILDNKGDSTGTALSSYGEGTIYDTNYTVEDDMTNFGRKQLLRRLVSDIIIGDYTTYPPKCVKFINNSSDTIVLYDNSPLLVSSHNILGYDYGYVAGTYGENPDSILLNQTIGSSGAPDYSSRVRFAARIDTSSIGGSVTINDVALYTEGEKHISYSEFVASGYVYLYLNNTIGLYINDFVWLYSSDLRGKGVISDIDRSTNKLTVRVGVGSETTWTARSNNILKCFSNCSWKKEIDETIDVSSNYIHFDFLMTFNVDYQENDFSHITRDGLSAIAYRYGHDIFCTWDFINHNSSYDFSEDYSLEDNGGYTPFQYIGIGDSNADSINGTNWDFTDNGTLSEDISGNEESEYSRLKSNSMITFDNNKLKIFSVFNDSNLSYEIDRNDYRAYPEYKLPIKEIGLFNKQGILRYSVETTLESAITTNDTTFEIDNTFNSSNGNVYDTYKKYFKVGDIVQIDSGSNREVVQIKTVSYGGDDFTFEIYEQFNVDHDGDSIVLKLFNTFTDYTRVDGTTDRTMLGYGTKLYDEYNDSVGATLTQSQSIKVNWDSDIVRLIRTFCRSNKSLYPEALYKGEIDDFIIQGENIRSPKLSIIANEYYNNSDEIINIMYKDNFTVKYEIDNEVRVIDEILYKASDYTYLKQIIDVRHADKNIYSYKNVAQIYMYPFILFKYDLMGMDDQMYINEVEINVEGVFSCYDSETSTYFNAPKCYIYNRGEGERWGTRLNDDGIYEDYVINVNVAKPYWMEIPLYNINGNQEESGEDKSKTSYSWIGKINNRHVPFCNVDNKLYVLFTTKYIDDSIQVGSIEIDNINVAMDSNIDTMVTLRNGIDYTYDFTNKQITFKTNTGNISWLGHKILELSNDNDWDTTNDEWFTVDYSYYNVFKHAEGECLYISDGTNENFVIIKSVEQDYDSDKLRIVFQSATSNEYTPSSSAVGLYYYSWSFDKSENGKTSVIYPKNNYIWTSLFSGNGWGTNTYSINKGNVIDYRVFDDEYDYYNYKNIHLSITDNEYGGEVLNNQEIYWNRPSMNSKEWGYKYGCCVYNILNNYNQIQILKTNSTNYSANDGYWHDGSSTFNNENDDANKIYATGKLRLTLDNIVLDPSHTFIQNYVSNTWSDNGSTSEAWINGTGGGGESYNICLNGCIYYSMTFGVTITPDTHLFIMVTDIFDGDITTPYDQLVDNNNKKVVKNLLYIDTLTSTSGDRNGYVDILDKIDTVTDSDDFNVTGSIKIYSDLTEENEITTKRNIIIMGCYEPTYSQFDDNVTLSSDYTFPDNLYEAPDVLGYESDKSTTASFGSGNVDFIECYNSTIANSFEVNELIVILDQDSGISTNDKIYGNSNYAVYKVTSISDQYIGVTFEYYSGGTINYDKGRLFHLWYRQARALIKTHNPYSDGLNTYDIESEDNILIKGLEITGARYNMHFIKKEGDTILRGQLDNDTYKPIVYPAKNDMIQTTIELMLEHSDTDDWGSSKYP